MHSIVCFYLRSPCCTHVYIYVCTALHFACCALHLSCACTAWAAEVESFLSNNYNYSVLVPAATTNNSPTILNQQTTHILVTNTCGPTNSVDWQVTKDYVTPSLENSNSNHSFRASVCKVRYSKDELQSSLQWWFKLRISLSCVTGLCPKCYQNNCRGAKFYLWKYNASKLWFKLSKTKWKLKIPPPWTTVQNLFLEKELHEVQFS